MALGFLKSLLGRGKVDEGPDLRGPLGLSPGDEVSYYQRSFAVVGVILVREMGEERWQYHLQDDQGLRAVLVAERDGEPIISLQQAVLEGADLRLEEGRAILDGRILARTHDGTAETVAVGEIPPRKIGALRSVEFEDGEEQTLLVVESWDGVDEVRSGMYVHEAELTVHRAGDDRFEARPPPKIDLRSVTEARRAREAAERKVARIELVSQDYRDLAALAAAGAAERSDGEGDDEGPHEDDQPSMS